MSQNEPSGFLSFTLHAHLPYVIHHGTWPHGLEWLLEAAAETYLPLLRVLRSLDRDGIALHCNLNLSPILLEQLAHPVFRAELPNYLERKVTSAREDEAFFASTGETHYAGTARFWQEFYTEALQDFEALNQDIAAGFRYFEEQGSIEIITCGATHGYMPLLGTDESVRAQVRLAVAAHKRHLGKAPRGVWVPECGYRPAGLWAYPVAGEGGQAGEGDEDIAAISRQFDRIGVEQALAESCLEFFYVDTHLIDESAHPVTPYRTPMGGVTFEEVDDTAGQRIYQPYVVRENSEISNVAVFARDPRSGIQVWSAETGYPADANYLDFHKKRWPGGHRYWRVTGTAVDMEAKEPYNPRQAIARTQVHASHFVELVRSSMQHAPEGFPPILTAAFDAELFGHWWFEGALWLEAVARAVHKDAGLQLVTSALYLGKYPPAKSIEMPEGSWGAGGDNRVWLNPDTAWTYQHLYEAELACREVCTSGAWKNDGPGERIVKQLCRELLLLESSDWQFLITTGAARDYAESRFTGHLESFQVLLVLWNIVANNGSLSEEEDAQLLAIEQRDSIFQDIEPSFWVEGSKETSTCQRAII